jgi:hypothetical protein
MKEIFIPMKCYYAFKALLEMLALDEMLQFTLYQKL